MNKNRILYIDIIKVLAIFLVIFNHSHWYIGTSINNITRDIYYLLYSLCKTAVPLFIMISGTLNLKKEITYKDIFIKRICRIFIPLLFIIIITVFANKGTIIDFIKTLFIDKYLDKNIYWLWYLYLMIGLYLITPLLQKMIKNFKNKDYIIFFTITILLVGLIDTFPSVFKLFFNEFMELKKDFTAGLFTVPLGYYVGGYYLDNLKLEKKYLIICTITLIFSIIMEFFILKYGINTGMHYDELLSYKHFLVAISAICVFIIIKYIFNNYRKDNLFSKTIIYTSNAVFGIYLFHVYLVQFLKNNSLFIMINDLYPLLSVILLDLVVIVILAIYFNIIKKNKYIKKFL